MSTSPSRRTSRSATSSPRRPVTRAKPRDTVSDRSARLARLIATFTTTYGGRPTFGVRAPGRVNLIGEHTDYNDGFCLPMAIDRDVRIVARPRADGIIRVFSLEQSQPVSFSLSGDITKATSANEHWADYVKGCALVLRDAQVRLLGADMAITGDVPLGSGLSSSAALEVATIHALLGIAGVREEGERIARQAQYAENHFVGTKCGILDQLASACSRAGEAMLMDCRTLGLTPAPLPVGVSVVIADSGKRRGLVDSAYNQRRRQCEAGAKALGVSHLRDTTLSELWAAHKTGRIDRKTLQRCEHVVAENGRTQAAFACLQAGDAVAFGQLMDQSHADLRDKFQVSCPELDDLVACARHLPGCLGSRMTGAGFGGCTVSLVQNSALAVFIPALLDAYQKRHPLPAAVYVTGAAAGAGYLSLR